MKFLSQIQPISLREQVVEQVRTAIIEGRLRPHDHITEAILTEQLGVSRTPVREALILLEREGLVVFAPNRGAFVRAFTADDVKDIFTMRTALENLAAECNIDRLGESDFKRLEGLIEQQRNAIERGDMNSAHSIDIEFHRVLVHGSGNRLLIRSWEEIVAQIAALLYIRSESYPDYDEHRAVRDHQEIVRAYRARDLAAVQTANRRINEQAVQECLQSLERSQQFSDQPA